MHKENNTESQKYYEDNKAKFHRQTRVVLKHLLDGSRITQQVARDVFKIHHLPRRICDIRQADIEVIDRRVKGGFKEYWIK